MVGVSTDILVGAKWFSSSKVSAGAAVEINAATMTVAVTVFE